MAFDRQGQINAPAISNPSDNNKNVRVPEFRPFGIWKVCLGISTSEKPLDARDYRALPAAAN